MFHVFVKIAKLMQWSHPRVPGWIHNFHSIQDSSMNSFFNSPICKIRQLVKTLNICFFCYRNTGTLDSLASQNPHSQQSGYLHWCSKNRTFDQKCNKILAAFTCLDKAVVGLIQNWMLISKVEWPLEFAK